MKCRIKYSLPVYIDIIDLTDYGHDENVKFEDLTEDEQNEITDNLRDEVIVNAIVETIDD